jgi:hypothetical protein
MSRNSGFGFVVGKVDGPRSSLWRVFWRGADVYLTQREWGGVAKLSLHRSEICRYALTQERHERMIAEGISAPSNRRMFSWQRNPTPPTGFAHVATIWVPTLVLTALGEISNRNIHWLSPAPLGMAVRIDLLYTKDDRAQLDRRMPTDARLFAATLLDNGETLMFVERQVQYNEAELLDRFDRMGVDPEPYNRDTAEVFETRAIECVELRAVAYIQPGDARILDILDMGSVRVRRSNGH